MKNKDLKRRILDISYQYQLSHLGSCLTAVDIIDEIFSIKKPGEKFVLSSGHAGLALYCVLEKYDKLDAEKIWLHHGVHPDRCLECHIDCSAGSLGQGLPIAVGMALADRTKNVYCLISDGECSEGSIYESIRIAIEQRLYNLKIYCNFNGWAAYKETSTDYIPSYFKSMVQFKYTNLDGWPSFLQGQIGHYKVMTENEYKEAIKLIL